MILSSDLLRETFTIDILKSLTLKRLALLQIGMAGQFLQILFTPSVISVWMV